MMKQRASHESEVLFSLSSCTKTKACVGEGKLRKLVSENPTADYLLWNGNRVQIKRVKFENFIDKLGAV